MEADFWHQKWQRGDIGFHQSQANPFLIDHLDRLGLAPGARIFLPLCGKTLDIAYLMGVGYRIAGAELSEIAIDELFQSLDLQPSIAELGALRHYRATGIDIFAGDIFELTASTLGLVDAVYDRAALVALPDQIRARYATHLARITRIAPQLAITYEYDQSLIDGPPFSVTAQELQRLYGNDYALTTLATREVEGGMKGKVTAAETAWLLQGKQQHG